MNTTEETSLRVAKIASRIMKMDRPFGVSFDLWEDIKSLAGSALTQAPNKPLSLDERYELLGTGKLNAIDPMGAAAANMAFPNPFLDPKIYKRMQDAKNK